MAEPPRRTTPELSIVVPAYNERARLTPTLERLAAFCAGRETVEVVIADDGSSDGTADLAGDFANTHPGFRVLRELHGGKGHAVRAGMQSALGRWRLFTDADLSTPIDEVDRLMESARAANAAIAIGSRALDRSLVGVHQSAAREWSGRLFNVIVRRISGLPFLDTQCGFKLYRADAAELVFARQRLDGFAFDVEDLVIARRQHLAIVEVPVRWNNDVQTKVSTRSGIRAFADLATIALNDARGRYR
jgi:glycosyltransferase involved in cell wall biosynthesis